MAAQVSVCALPHPLTQSQVIGRREYSAKAMGLVTILLAGPGNLLSVHLADCDIIPRPLKMIHLKI